MNIKELPIDVLNSQFTDLERAKLTLSGVRNLDKFLNIRNDQELMDMFSDEFVPSVIYYITKKYIQNKESFPDEELLKQTMRKNYDNYIVYSSPLNILDFFNVMLSDTFKNYLIFYYYTRLAMDLGHKKLAKALYKALLFGIKILKRELNIFKKENGIYLDDPEISECIFFTAESIDKFIDAFNYLSCELLGVFLDKIYLLNRGELILKYICKNIKDVSLKMYLIAREKIIEPIINTCNRDYSNDDLLYLFGGLFDKKLSDKLLRVITKDWKFIDMIVNHPRLYTPISVLKSENLKYFPRKYNDKINTQADYNFAIYSLYYCNRVNNTNFKLMPDILLECRTKNFKLDNFDLISDRMEIFADSSIYSKLIDPPYIGIDIINKPTTDNEIGECDYYYDLENAFLHSSLFNLFIDNTAPAGSYEIRMKRNPRMYLLILLRRFARKYFPNARYLMIDKQTFRIFSIDNKDISHYFFKKSYLGDFEDK